MCIKVSIICNAYNHEAYIADALEGFVMQKTTFPFEVLVHDDASTDNTAQIIRDYDRVIQLNPSFVFAYFNRANLRCAQRDFRAAIVDYDEAIRRDPDFAAAYFNRGLAKLSLGQATDGIADLSKAGELGIYNAYSIIKRMTAR